MRLPSGSTLITACRSKSEFRIQIGIGRGDIICMCLVWHIVLSRTIFNSGDFQAVLSFLICVSLSDSSSSILECTLVKGNRWFQFHRMNSQQRLQTWVKPLFIWLNCNTGLRVFVMLFQPCLVLLPSQPCFSAALPCNKRKGQQSPPDQSFVSNIHYKR